MIMKNKHWRSLKKGMSCFLSLAIAIGSQGTGLSAATLDYGQDYVYTQEENLSTDLSYSSDDVQVQSASSEEDLGSDQAQEAISSDASADSANYQQIDSIGNDSENNGESMVIDQDDQTASDSQKSDQATASDGDATDIEEIFSDGEDTDFDSGEETAQTNLLDASTDAQEGTIQYLIENARKAGSTQLTISIGESFPSIIEENLLIPRGMAIVLDLNGHTLTVDKTDAEADKDTSNITVYGTLTLKNGSLSGSTASAGNENTRGVMVAYGGRLILGEGAEITGYLSSGRGGGVYVSEGARLSIEGGSIHGNQAGISGGGVWIYSAGLLSFISGTISDNQAVLNGGGIYIHECDSESSIWGSDISITENHADNNGGGLYIYRATSPENEIIFDGLTVKGNTAGRNGGGVYFQGEAHFTMKGGNISNNQAVAYGGGMYFYSENKHRTTVNLLGGVIQGNKLIEDAVNYYGADVHYGGGVWIGSYASGMISNVQILDNETIGTGGGLAIGGYSKLKIQEGTLVKGNKALFNAGGILASGANVEMTGGEICENQATGSASFGGGFYINSGTLTASGGRICGNYSAAHAGGGFATTAILFGDVVISGNKANGYGGGLYANVTMSENVRIEENTANNMGGGIYSALVMNGGIICNNTAGGNGGAGVYGSVTLNDGEISGNHASGNGGGVRGSLKMTGGVIKENTTNTSGGAFFGYGTVSGGEITGNRASNMGGGACLFENGRQLTITGSVRIYNNQAAYGGAVSLSGSTVQINGGVISDNTAAVYGGGVYVGIANGLQAPKLMIEKEAVISDNQISGSGAVIGGSDLYVIPTQKFNNNGNILYLTPVVSVSAANQMTSKDGTTGIAWYDEDTKERLLTGLELDDTERTKAYRCTFFYSEPEAEMTALLDDSQEYATVQAAVDAAGDGQLHKITLLKETKEAVTIPQGSRIRFDLNGTIIRGTGQSYSPVFTVRGEMLLEDSSKDQTGCIVGGTWAENNKGGGIFVKNGSLTMESGTIGENNGGGVFVSGKDSSFVMKGGLITKNKFIAVSVYMGSFRMTGGKISGNSASQGGTIYSEGGARIRIEDGEISGNSGNQGGGLFVRSGRLTITGGRICNNKAVTSGGGIYIFNGCIADISGGEISGNTVTNINPDYGGAGIYVSSATLNIAGGVIKGNTSRGAGGGIRVYSGSVSVTGGSIYDNHWILGKSDIYAAKGASLTLLSAGSMEQGAYNLWNDYENGQTYKEDIQLSNLERTYHFYAAYEKEQSEDAAQLLDENGKEQNYPSVQEAVDAAADRQRIFLLRDCEEAIQIGKDKNVILDLNGYALSSSQEAVITIKGSLEVDSTTDNPYTNPEQSQDGQIRPAENVTGTRGIYVKTGGSVILSGGMITGFSGVEYGGGIYADQDGSVTVQGGEITGNQALYGGGIGFYSIGTSSPSFFTMTGGKIWKNRAEQNGGGVYMGRPYNLQNQILISDGEICENTAGGRGGGLSAEFTEGVARASKVTISGGKVHHNTAGTDGAGIFIRYCKTAVIGPDLEVSYNIGSGNGGGLRIEAAEELTVENLCAHHNQAKNGGGLSLNAAELLVKDCKAYSNSTSRYGSAGYSGGAGFYASKRMEIQKGEFWSNGAYFGGGVGVGTAAGGEAVIGKAVSIHDNRAIDGGGLRIDSVGTLTVNGLIENNSGSNGGGIKVSTTSSQIHFTDVVVQNNKASAYGGGIYFASASASKVYIEDPAQILDNTSNMGGGIAVTTGYEMYMTGGRIAGNKANVSQGNGGGIYTQLGLLTLSGGVIENNNAINTGGGICISSSKSWSTRRVRITGDVRIINNQAGTGGGVGVAENTSLTMDGGLIYNNKANSGGGVWVSAVMGEFVLEKSEETGSTGKLYGNQAGYGRDINGSYDKNYKNSLIRLYAAEDMFGAEDDKKGNCWYNETRNTSITDPINYDPVTAFCYLTFQYDSLVPVAKIQNQEGSYDAYTSLQAAINAVKEGKYQESAPQIYLVKDIHESIQVSGEVCAVLNLNGHKLLGTGTGITCSGNLRIVDEKTEGLDPGEDTGTISGSSRKLGGGILVMAGGYVTMEGGQISMCSAPSNQTGYGGAGVAVSGGTFILDKTASINECSATFGSAVYVGAGSSLFEMRGGTIRNNKVFSYGSGVIYSAGGTVRISGGSIADNVSNSKGIVYLAGGKSILEGGEITRNTAVYGGAVYVGTTANVQMSNIQLSGNKATTNGGAIYNEGTLSIFEGTRITGNQAVYGGAIYQNTGSIKMAGGSITGNQAEKGGGLAQNPQVANAGSFVMSGGLICRNKSTVDGTGNDIYSLYEGSGNYENVSVNQKPAVTLIQAAAMTDENGDASKYNAWKNDAYKGDQLEGTDVINGYYVTGGINQSNNLKLTAISYKEAEVKGPESTVKVDSIAIRTTRNEDGTSDGNGAFDTKCAEDEKTAQQLLDQGDSNTYESPDQITEDETQEQMAQRHHYLYNDQILKMICHNGVWYERDQAVLWSPGNDSSATNGVIRSFDTVKYDLRFTLEDMKQGSKDENNEDNEDSQETVDDTLQLWVEMLLPADSSIASFYDTNNMKYYYIYEQKQADGSYVQYLRGYWELEENKGGTVYRTLSINIKGMNNGDLLKPSFTAWVGGNEDNELHPKSCNSKILTVSAAPRYNILLRRNSQLAYTSYFDMANGEETTEEAVKKAQEAGEDTSNIVYGTMLGYGITLQLYNDRTDKGMRGIQIPSGDIQFDVSFGGELVLNGATLGDNAAPYAWAYKANENGDTGASFTAAGNLINMNWNDEDDYTKTTSYGWDAAPYNSGNNSMGCYSGGSWNGEVKQRQKTGDKRLTLHFTVSNYAVGASSPYSTSNNAWNSQLAGGGQIRSFSAGYVQVLYPFDKESVKDQSGYLEINMECAASDLDIHCVTGLTPESTDKGLDVMESFFGEDYQSHAISEMTYLDNYLNYSTGLYIYDGTGNGDSIGKNNYFSKDNGTENISTKEGTGSTPLGSQVYIDSDVVFTSQEYHTDDKKDPHYIPTEEFDPQVDNLREYNYLTAVNVLQKFDSDAYTPTCGEKILDRQVNQSASNTWNWVGKSAGTNSTNAFLIGTSETATTWSSAGSLKTKSFKLTVLYGAKPDGTNWVKTDTESGPSGGEADMDAYTEEDLIYFTSLDELKAYFAAKGNPDGRCVALLYEVRDCCIRTGRSLFIRSRMQVTKEFKMTGGTYCTTNDVRGWTTYRPTYKKYYNEGKRDSILFAATWRSRQYDTTDGITVYGNGDKGGALPDGYIDSLTESQDPVMKYTKQKCELYFNGYRKTEYENGVKKNGTHTMGWIAGNTLLLYTLVSEIGIKNTDLLHGSNREKTYYNVSDGERTANFLVMPKLEISSATKNYELVANGSQATDVEITLTLPKDLHYNKGSLVFDYAAPGKDCKYRTGDLAWSVKQTDNPDGSTTLTISTTVNDINKGLPYIRYNCTIGKKGAAEDEDVKNNQQLTTNVKINTTYAEINRITGMANTAEQTITVTRTKNDVIYKETDRSLVEIGDDLVYYLNYGNYTENPEQIQLCDILPANGDGRDSSFSGGYRIREIYLDFTNEEDREKFLDGNAGQLKYRQGISPKELTQEERTQIFDTIGKGKWYDIASSYEESEHTENGTRLYRLTCRTDANGLWANGEQLIHYADGSGTIDAIYGFVPAVDEKAKLRMGVVLTPLQKDEETLITSRNTAQQGGDVYNNNFFYRSGGLTSHAPTVLSPRVGIRTAKRKISGLVWLDQDQNGNYRPSINGYPTTDRLLSRVDVYLYQESRPASSKITENQDGSFSQVIGGKTLTMSPTTIDGKTLYPAVDIVGNLLDKVITGNDGAYAFNNLAEGSYYLVLQDEGDDYVVTGGTRTLPFKRLSVTPKREDTKISLSQPGTDTDKALPEYEGRDTTDQGAAAMKRTVITNNGSGITLPGLSDMISWEYVTNHWDCGLYYLDLSMEKNWSQTTSVPDQAAVLFEITGNTGTGTDTVSYQAVTYTAKLSAGKVTAQAEGLARPYSKAEGAPTQIQVPVTTSQDKGKKTMLWSVKNQPLQAEGASGQIRYEIEERAKDGEGNPLPGFIMTRTSDSIEADQTRKFAVWNTQILYSISLGKIGSQKEALSNAVFTLYKDKDCKIPAGASMKTDEQGIGTITGLEAGTGADYYIKETKAPSGYFLNKGILKLTVAYKDQTKPYDPSILVERITDEITGDPLDPSTDQDKMSIQIKVDASGEDPDSLVPQVPLKYNVSFEIADSCIYSLPKTGGRGIWLEMLLGTGMMLVAVYLYSRKRRNAV